MEGVRENGGVEFVGEEKGAMLEEGVGEDNDGGGSIPNDNVLPNYIRPLAFNDKGREMLKKISENVQVVFNLSSLTDDIGKIFADEERRATDLFGFATPEIKKGFSEFTDKNIPYINTNK